MVANHLAGIARIKGIGDHIEVDGHAGSTRQVAHNPSNGKARGIHGVDGDRHAGFRHGPLAVVGPVLGPA